MASFASSATTGGARKPPGPKFVFDKPTDSDVFDIMSGPQLRRGCRATAVSLNGLRHES